MSVHDEVLAAAKDMLRLNLTAGTSGNVSGRTDDGHVVITPSSIPYDTMTLDDLVVIAPWLRSPWDPKAWIDDGDDFGQLDVKRKALERYARAVLDKIH